MTGTVPIVVDVSGGNLVLVVVVALIALGALAMAAMFRAEVMSAAEGTSGRCLLSAMKAATSDSGRRA